MQTVKQDAYTWRAYYGPGQGYLDEFHAVAGFASVESGCTALSLQNQETEAEHVVEIPSGATPVFFRRRSITVNLVDESTESRQTMHCIGWKRDDNAVYLFIGEDGSTLLTDNLQAV